MEFLVSLQFLGMALLALTWWRLMPGGFSPENARFWMNQVVPPLLVGGCIWGLICVLRERIDALWRLQSSVLAMFSGAAITGTYLYPRSMGTAKLLTCATAGFLGVAVISALVLAALRAMGGSSRSVAWQVFIGFSCGAFIPVSQRGAEAATRPAEAILTPPRFSGPAVRGNRIEFGDNVTVRPQGAVIEVKNDGLTLHVEPLLTFESISPDRFWTLFSPEPGRLQRLMEARAKPGRFVGTYDAGHFSILDVKFTNDSDAIHVDAFARIKATVYSHLNSFSTVYLFGANEPSVSFSPCHGPFAILPSDYPAGRPARFATLKSGSRFEVLEGASGEKGPFRVLGAGSLSRAAPLVMTLYDNSVATFRIRLHDWSAQASTQISPTAGWDVCENAIEFSRSDGGSLVMIHITLASTSVGRGWDSVGHRPGTYRNRITVERIRR